MSKIGKITSTGVFKKLLVAVVLFGLMAGVLASFYNIISIKTVNVLAITTQQRIEGNDGGLSTHYDYIVSTDCGLFKIQPSGLFASQSFGQIHEGEQYTITAIGFSIPLLNIYPYIITAEGGEE